MTWASVVEYVSEYERIRTRGRARRLGGHLQSRYGPARSRRVWYRLAALRVSAGRSHAHRFDVTHAGDAVTTGAIVRFRQKAYNPHQPSLG